jgi:hypothetical protein
MPNGNPRDDKPKGDQQGGKDSHRQGQHGMGRGAGEQARQGNPPHEGDRSRTSGRSNDDQGKHADQTRRSDKD